MSGPLLGTFSIEGLRPLGSPAQRSFELVHSTLSSMLDRAHADLFAEPVAARHGNLIDWYSAVEGTSQRAMDLPESDCTALLVVLEERLARIRALAGTLATRKGSEEDRLAEALSNACTYPDAGSVFAVRGTDGALHPVITNWAWSREEQRIVRGVLAGQALRTAGGPSAGRDQAGRMPAGHAAAGAHGGATATAGHVGGVLPWLLMAGWLLLATMIAAILWLVVHPCALRPALLGAYCPADPTASGAPSATTPPLPDAGALEAELARLQALLVDRQSLCTRTLESRRVEAYRQAEADRAEAEAEAEARDAAEAAAQEAPKGAAVTDSAATPATEAQTQELEERLVAQDAIQGELAFSLAWNSDDDLDLKVTCPSGEKVSYQTKTRMVCGGKLDIDANTLSSLTDSPIENIYFDDVQPGLYGVSVRLHASRSGMPQTFTLRVKSAWGAAQVVSGSVSPSRPDWTWSLRIGE